MKNTNILEVATFAAVVVIVGFLIKMSVSTVEDSEITTTQLTDEFELKKKTYMINVGEETKSVVLSADCQGKNLNYKWKHAGSFSNVKFDGEGFRLHTPAKTKWTWIANSDLSLYGSDGYWTEKNIMYWEKISWNGMPLDNANKLLKVDLTAGMHVFESEVTNGENLSEDSLLFIYVGKEKEQEDISIPESLACSFNHAEFDCVTYLNKDDCLYFNECSWTEDNTDTEDDESSCKFKN